MRYQVEVVADHELPPGLNQVLVERPADQPLLLVRESAASEVLRWSEKHLRGSPHLVELIDGTG